MTVEDLMTKKVVIVKPATPLIEAVDVLTRNSFEGMPVVDPDNRLVGLLTERSLIASSSYVHLKTLLKLFNQIKFYKKDNTPIRDDLKKILDMKVADIMEIKPTTVTASSSIEQATALFADPRNNPLPVVDQDNKLVGILALSDLTKLYGITLRDSANKAKMEQNIDQFIDKFEKEFVVVTKTRTRLWLLVSLMFTIIGFIIAFMLIIRIT
ncbi:MAG: CBS domain-containing protein [Candidatus Doudnabacteria bacterium]|nr:CBS domain-containing protein [Candidatus Doudnabacteria bacterium]